MTINLDEFISEAEGIQPENNNKQPPSMLKASTEDTFHVSASASSTYVPVEELCHKEPTEPNTDKVSHNPNPIRAETPQPLTNLEFCTNELNEEGFYNQLTIDIKNKVQSLYYTQIIFVGVIRIVQAIKAAQAVQLSSANHYSRLQQEQEDAPRRNKGAFSDLLFTTNELEAKSIDFAKSGQDYISELFRTRKDKVISIAGVIDVKDFIAENILPLPHNHEMLCNKCTLEEGLELKISQISYLTLLAVCATFHIQTLGTQQHDEQDSF